MLFLTKIVNFLERTLSLISYRVSNLGQSVLMAMVLLVVADVVLRRAFNSPLPFSYELVEVMLVVAVFFAVAYTGTQKSHVGVDVLVSRFPPKAQAIVNAVIWLISTGLFGFVSWQSIAYGMRIWDIGQETAILGVPYYPFVFVVALGSILLALVLLVQFLNYIIDVVKE